MPQAPTYDLPALDDFAATCQRFEAWWNCEVTDRPPVTLYTCDQPARPPGPAAPTYADHRARWFDIEQRLAAHAHAVSHTRYVGDTVPTFMPNLGPEVVATCYGAELTFTDSTSWAEPCCASAAEVCQRQLSRDGAYWQWILNATKRSLELGAGKWLTAGTDLHTSGDLIAALRDPQEILLEMALDDAAVDTAMHHLAGIFEPLYRDQADPIRAIGQPMLSWTNCLCDGFGGVVQCDLICMLSPAHFQRFILPLLQEEMAFLDRSLFHLDGPGALRHLDDFIACDDLDAIQWVYGAGGGKASDWTEVYQRIQAGGKAMHIVCADLNDARGVMQAIGPAGAWFEIHGSYPMAEVDAFLKEVTEWRAPR
ncbi:MAG: hypothetical protein PF961_04440 [Planctomycetota bacterium]|jgi:hypothetical protein|nr:hypothetical protein [Planctomycetota bacterium]